MKIVDGLCSLIDDVAFMLFSQHVFPNQRIKVDVHVLEQDVDILLIHGADNLFWLDDVGMVEFFNVHYLSISSLRIRWVLECIKILLEGVELVGSAVCDLPDHPVGSTPYLFEYLEAP
jgi:hypothetical protein